MKILKNSLVVLILGIAVNCNFKGQIRDSIAQNGQVLKEWDEGADHCMVMKESNKIIKYRISQKGGSMGVIAGAPEYSIDSLTGLCYGPNGGTIKCELLKKDPNFAEFVPGK